MLSKLPATFAGILVALAASQASAAVPSDYDGVYVGTSTSLSGGNCPQPQREYGLVVEDGQARLLYNIRVGTLLTGYVNSEGAVKLKGQQEIYTISLTGNIFAGGNAKLLSSSTGGGSPCNYEYTLQKK